MDFLSVDDWLSFLVFQDQSGAAQRMDVLQTLVSMVLAVGRVGGVSQDQLEFGAGTAREGKRRPRDLREHQCSRFLS